MRATVLADFGSTYTKVTVVDSANGDLLAHAEFPTTLTSDVMDGYEVALERALRDAPDAEIEQELAASSAAGGLRVAAVGLVEDLTAAAASKAALNAGARVEIVLSGVLDRGALARLRTVSPEIVLFAGGTDGGQRDRVLANAAALAPAVPAQAVVIVACNADISEAVIALFGDHGVEARAVVNVMPGISELRVEPAREAMLRAFLTHVIDGKALNTSGAFRRMVVMPTPEAVLRATQLLAAGTETRPGVGDVVVVDVGGATTDVHSVVSDATPMPGLTGPLLPVLPVQRTVQGDLGMRSGAPGVLAVDRKWLTERWHPGGRGGSIDVEVERRHFDPDLTSSGEEDRALDRCLAIACITHALRRHCGRLETRIGQGGPPRFMIDGPDLRRVPLVLGTGGVLVHAPDGTGAINAALERYDPRSCVPQAPRVAIDQSYLLPAAGLLATVAADAAMTLLSENLFTAM